MELLRLGASMQNLVRTVLDEGAWESAGFELAPQGSQRLAAFTCPRCLGESRAGGVDIHAPRCSEPHTCAPESLRACFSRSLETGG